MTTSTQRRTFLKLAAAGLGSVALPFARTVTAEETHPRRAIFVFFPDGMTPSDWHAQGTGYDFTLPGMTQPLERVREHCLFLNGVHMYGPGSTHEGGVAKLLTGAAGRSSDGAVSLDYYLGQYFKNQTIRPLLNLGIVPVYRNKHISFDFNGTAVMPELNPLAAFESLFGADAQNNFQNQRRLSALDASLTELNALRSQLASTEQAKLEMHLDSLRELERKLNSDDAGGCPAWNFNPSNFEVTRTKLWQNPEFLDSNQLDLIGNLHTDVAVHALSCDLTRVVTLKWNNSVNDTVIQDAGTSKTCHQASHESGIDFVRIKAWYNEKLAQLIEQLRSVPEGDGTLLDNTVIFVGSDLANGSWHNHTNMPFILAGGGAAGWETGRSLHYNDAAHNKILVSIARFMGVDINQFGTQDATPGELPGLFG